MNDELSLSKVGELAAKFAKDRDWEQFHTPRNLALAMVGEVGEVCECFQWKSENHKWTQEEKEHLGEELSDVLIYLVRLADRSEIDLSTAVLKKLAKNDKKYPVERVKGSSKKYNEYKDYNPDDI